MKYLLFIPLLAVSLLIKAQDDTTFPYEKVSELTKEKLQVRKMGDTQFVLTNKTDTQRYFAYNLPDDYKTDGLNVICSGIVGKVPPNVRMMGTPLKLSFIAVGKGYRKFKVKAKSFNL